MQTIYPPHSDSIEYPQIKIFIPYTEIQPATLIALIGYNYTPVKVEGDYGYSEYFKKRWEEKQTFISIEQDIVIWPGAPDAIWNCSRELCTYDIHLPNHRKRNLEAETRCVPPGCIKFSKEFIEKTPGFWDTPIKWDMVDQHLITSGIRVHQHYPGVVNANPVLLGGNN